MTLTKPKPIALVPLYSRFEAELFQAMMDKFVQEFGPLDRDEGIREAVLTVNGMAHRFEKALEYYKT